MTIIKSSKTWTQKKCIRKGKALPSGGGFDMMGSAMVAIAITDSWSDFCLLMGPKVLWVKMSAVALFISFLVGIHLGS